MKVKVGEFGQWVKETFVETNGVDLRGAKQIASAANSLWAITCAGVVKFDGKSWCTANADWTEQPSLLLASRNGTIWVNAGEQIFLWNGTSWRTLDKPFKVSAWTEAEDGTVWLVADGCVVAIFWRMGTGDPNSLQRRSQSHRLLAQSSRFGDIFWVLVSPRQALSLQGVAEGFLTHAHQRCPRFSR